MPGARSPWRQNFVQQCLIFLNRQFGICSMSPFWRLEFSGGSQIFEKFVLSVLKLTVLVSQF